MVGLDNDNELIIRQVKAVADEMGGFVAGILSNDITRDDQIAFALRLVRLAEHIKERADQAPGMVIEGGVLDGSGSGRPAIPAAAVERADHPCPADHV